ncbi:signal peptidase I [Aliifodinibius halophilus]|uniref:Signal peptidase I n=1 Tax=Fodinibius halophilus TaxID=1736908 RepID=A0A6M1TD56_9BACT|nr:signal peptidase I [Fodinibius halophilus]
MIITVALFCKNCICSVYYVPTSSMSPTIVKGSYILVTKFDYQFRSPSTLPFTNISIPVITLPGLAKPDRNDIVIFEKNNLSNSSHDVFLKRVVGIPRDRVWETAEYSEVNGIVLKKPSYYSRAYDNLGKKNYSYQIPAKGKRIPASLFREGAINEHDGQVKVCYIASQNFYYMAGDNRKNSNDSRYWGLISEENILGRVRMVLWPWPPRWL